MRDTDMSKVALNFNDDNDKHKEGRNRRRQPLSKRVTVTHKCEHTASYPSTPKFDYGIKKNVCPMCQEWFNPDKQMEDEGMLI
jgi:hypothetical protein